MAKCIFVLGTARSGTTWLSNLLSSHPQIAAITAKEHKGIHESHLFDHTRYFFPDRMNAAEFLEEYQKEDYFKLTRIEKEEFCSNHPEHGDIYYFFNLIMEEYAASKGSRYWLEKTPKHTIYFKEICEKFKDAYFISIERDFADTLLSNLNMYAKPNSSRWIQIVEKVYRYVSDYKAISILKRNKSNYLITVRYEDLLENKDRELRKILNFLDLDFFPLESRFLPDSSFKVDKKPSFAFSKVERFWVNVLKQFLSLVPFRLMFYIRKRRDLANAVEIPKYSLLSSVGNREI